MNSCIVSLKNLYRLLTVTDYPVYSENVFTRKNLQNITLIRFWKQVLPYSWRNTPAGKMIWRTEGSSNRLHSELCNRKPSFRYYESYLSQIMDLIRTEGLKGAVDLVSDFLKTHHYNAVSFRRKTGAFLSRAEEEDPEFGAQACPWIRSFLLLYQNSQIPASFLDGWFFVMLTLHAIAGTAMNGDLMVQFRSDRAITPEGIYYREVLRVFPRGGNIFLTNKNSALYSPSRGENRFFGRETEIFDIEEMLRSPGRHLIWGIGGIGKTHLLRVSLRHALEERHGCRIALVQFEGGLTESFAQSFLNLESLAAQDILGEVLYLLNEKRPEQTILLIDNLDVHALTDADRELLTQLKCCVIASSRQSSLPGFESYPIGEIDYDSAALIFRNHYAKVLNKEEKQQLSQMIRENRICHPLLLTFLGKNARVNHLSVDEVAQQLKQANASGEEVPDPGSRELFRGLYRISGLGREAQHLARLFSILPYQAFGTTALQTLAGKNLVTVARLRQLAQEGFLQNEDGRWSMHPVIAESISYSPASESEFSDIWKIGAQRIALLPEQWEKGVCTEEILQAAQIGGISADEFTDQIRLLVGMAFRMRGPVSRPLLLMCEYGVLFLAQIQETGKKTLEHLDSLYACCLQKDEETDLARSLICIQIMNGEAIDYPQFRRQLRAQEENRTVSDWLFWQSFQAIHGLILLREDPGTARRMVQEALRREVPEPFTDLVSVSLHYNLANLCMIEMDADGARAEAEMIEALAKKRPEGFAAFRAGADCFAAYALAGTGRTEEAGKYIEDAGACENAIRTLELRILYLDAKAAVQTGRGDLKGACRMRGEMVKIAAMRTGEGSMEWCMCEASYGLSLYRAHCNEEALEADRAAIEGFREQASYRSGLMMTLNNMAVIYLDAGQADQALPLLMEALEIAPGTGQVGVAECRFNLARARALQGDTKQEKQLLAQCLPVFEKYYGEQHPKTVRIVNRLREL